MEPLIVEQAFAQGLQENGLIVWGTSGKSIKACIFNGHKREDVLDYRELFLNEMKNMASDFLLPWSTLKLLSLSPPRQNE